MKTITDKYEYLALVECSCCREDHTVKLVKDDSLDELWFEFDNAPFSFWESFRLKRRLFSNPRSFVNGPEILNNGILLSKDQLTELAGVLSTRYDEGIPLETKRVTYDERTPLFGAPNFWSNLKNFFTKRTVAVTYDLVYVGKELVLSYDLDVAYFNLGYKLNDAENVRGLRNSFWNGKYQLGVPKTDVGDFLSSVKAYLANVP